MSDPTGYSVSYNFGNFQASSPTTPLPATKLDNELANIAESNASIVSAVKDVRRSDGKLQNNIVTYESLALALQLIFDPTDGQAVADAVAAAQAAATAASGSATAAGTSATNAAASAAAAAASAGSVNLTLYLSKAGNLAGMGNNDTALANIGAMKNDASNATGRLAKAASVGVSDWNLAINSGFYSSAPGIPNAPDTANYWLVEVLAADPSQNYITQIAYQFVGAATSADSVLIYRRHSYDTGSGRGWTPWMSNGAVPVGTTIYVNSVNAPPGYLKENGALLARTTFPALWNYAAASGNIVDDATWLAGATGAFSTGDLVSTFRLPDSRGEFFRAYDDGRGVDPGRPIGTHQADLLRDHTHQYDKLIGSLRNDGTSALTVNTAYVSTATSGVNAGLGGAETRPRNNAKLACIKY